MSRPAPSIAPLILFALVPVTRADTFEPPVPGGSAPHVNEWIWIQVADVDHYMLPILYFSTSSFKTRVPEVVVVLPRKSYNFVATLTEDLVTRPGCSTSWTPPFARYSVAVTERRNGHTQRCILQKAPICEYLEELKGSGEVNWTPKRLEPIGYFVQYLGSERTGGRLTIGWSDRVSASVGSGGVE